jgi:hypothetical protein
MEFKFSLLVTFLLRLSLLLRLSFRRTACSHTIRPLVFEARAQVAGVVLYVCAVPSMMKGATIASVGVVVK